MLFCSQKDFPQKISIQEKNGYGVLFSKSGLSITSFGINKLNLCFISHVLTARHKINHAFSLGRWPGSLR
jgi:hypothetical protein